MRLLPLTTAAALVLAVVPATAGADDPPTGRPGPGYVATPNVEHLLTVPLDGDAAGGRLLGKDFFVRTAKGVTVYDASDPLLPVPKGFAAVPATPNQEREDIDTDGEVLVTGQSIDGVLYVLDVRNRTAPRLVSALPGGADHTNTCVLSCQWVYGSEGTIVDLRDPTRPRVAGDWEHEARISQSHDVTEVSPGLLLVASNPVVLLDARRDPANPRRVAVAPMQRGLYVHGTAWPRGGRDRFALAGSESDYGCRRPEQAALVVVDTRTRTSADGERRWATTGHWTIGAGLPTAGRGQVPASELCGHWFDPHPRFRDGGLVAMAWYGFGVRFLEVTKAGAVKERGFWQPAGQTSSVYWMSDDVVWTLDYAARGIDVLRFDADAPSGRDAAVPGRWTPASELRDGTASAPVGHHGRSVGELAREWVCRPGRGVVPGVPVAA